jgi:hypothetical protein
MDYIYFLANASLTLRVVQRCWEHRNLPIRFMTVIHQVEGWIVRIKMTEELDPEQDGDFRAFMTELGGAVEPNITLRMALWSLETGQSCIDVMQRYQVAVVSHGIPDRADIESFREQFIQGLGYCPETLA